MDGSEAPEAVLITGVYGSGKSSVAAELTTYLDENEPGVSYGAIDLDWLGWFNARQIGEHSDEATRVMERNLVSVIQNYAYVGVDRFILAGAYLEPGREVASLRAAIAMPLRVVGLHDSLEEVRRRLSPSPESGRAEDLEQAEEWLASDAAGFSFADLMVDGEQPLPEVARTIAEWLGWKGDAS